jgi:hypothetical protein
LLGAVCGFSSGTFYVLEIAAPHAGNMGDGAIPIVCACVGSVIGPIVTVVAVLMLRARRARSPF